MNSTCYFCHLNLGWHSAAVHCAQQTPASLMLQAHRPLSWAITETTLPAAKWKPGVRANVTESFEKQISPMKNSLVIVVLVLVGLVFSFLCSAQHLWGTMRTTAQVENWGTFPCLSLLFPPIPSKSSSLDIISRFLSKSLFFVSFSLFL